MKLTLVDDEVDDTDIDGTEVFTGVQVAKQVRSSMKKWIKKQDDVFGTTTWRWTLFTVC